MYVYYKAKTERKKLKDRLGKEHKDLFMIDSSYPKGVQRYCDAILVSDDIDAWDKGITQYYEKHTHTQWRRRSSLMDTENAYTNLDNCLCK